MRVILGKVTASFRQGELVAILGPSGSGKSTLLNLISGIDVPDSGEIWLDDTLLTGLSDRERTMFRRRRIGFVFQFFNLIPTLTVWENVTLPLELDGGLTSESAAQVETLLDSVGLLHRRSASPDRLSGGEQQRVAIARALAHDPLLVLADEPTGNLDEHTGQSILTLMDNLTRKMGKTMILVTHSAEAAALADRILLLHDGRLVEQPHIRRSNTEMARD